MPINQDKFDMTQVQVRPVVYGCATPEASLERWDGCSELHFGEQVCLLDQRDGKTYWAGKFADDRCWLLNDLRFGGSSDGCAGRQEFNGLEAGITDRFGDGTRGDCRESDVDGAGYFYNFAAATQGETGERVRGLCPPGWHVPSGGAAGELAALADTSARDSFWRESWRGSLAGDAVFSGELFGQGLFGYYWSATPAPGGKAYNLQLTLGESDVVSIHDQTIGFLLRCVQD